MFDKNFLDDFVMESDIDIENIELTPADEAYIFLAGLKDACESDQEYSGLIDEAALEMEIYDLIPNAEIVTEAKKIVKSIITTQSMFSAEQKRAVLRLAAAAKDTNYDKYKKHRNLMREYRQKLYEKYGSKAKAVARDVMRNSKNKASSMKSPAGKSIVAKIDKQIAKTDANARNGKAIKKING